MFLYSQYDKSFYKCLNEYGGTFTKISWSWCKVSMNRKTVNTPRTFCIYWVQRVTLPTILPQSHWVIAVWTWGTETRVYWWCQIFHKIIFCIKILFISKIKLFSYEFWNSSICYWQPLRKLSSLHPASGISTKILLIQNVTP